MPQANRLELCCCAKVEPPDLLTASRKYEGFLYTVFKKVYAPALLNKFVRPVVVSSPLVHVLLPLVPGHS